MKNKKEKKGIVRGKLKINGSKIKKRDPFASVPKENS